MVLFFMEWLLTFPCLSPVQRDGIRSFFCAALHGPPNLRHWVAEILSE
jgi:hypothetical protein